MPTAVTSNVTATEQPCVSCGIETENRIDDETPYCEICSGRHLGTGLRTARDEAIEMARRGEFDHPFYDENEMRELAREADANDQATTTATTTEDDPERDDQTFVVGHCENASLDADEKVELPHSSSSLEAAALARAKAPDLNGSGGVLLTGDEDEDFDSFFDENDPLVQFMKEWKAGRSVPQFDVELDTSGLSPRATDLRMLAAAISAAFGYSLQMGDTKAPLIAGSFAVWMIGGNPRKQDRYGRKLLDGLAQHKVIRYERSAEPLDGRLAGTRCFQPFGYDLAELFARDASTSAVPGNVPSADPVESNASGDVPDDVAVTDPAVEIADEQMMRKAKIGRVVRPVGVVAAGDGAGGSLGHSADDTGPPGSSRTVADLSETELLDAFPGSAWTSPEVER